MRAVVKNGVGVFYPQGFLDGNSVLSMLSISDIEATMDLNVTMILVSLKKVIFFNRNGLEAFVRMFQKLKDVKHIIVGFCDYDLKKYNSIIKFYDGDLSFSLFKTLEIAYLFSSSFTENGKKVLVYSEDKSQRTILAIELYDHGHTPIIAQTKEDFLEKSKRDGVYDVIIEYTILNQIDKKIATRVTGNAIIYTVSSFLDADISTDFDLAYHNNSLNIGFRLFIFDACRVVSMNIHALNFFTKLATLSAEYDANICFAGLSFEKIPNAFKEALEDVGIMFFEYMDDILKDKELLKRLGGSISSTMKKRRSINKDIVLKLPNFIEATVSTIEIMTNSKAQKEASKVDRLEINDKFDKIASSIGFYGDIDGMVVLVFPINIARKACELFIGEDTEDKDLILDTLAELVNIVGGRIKMLLSEEHININITLPRTYMDIDSLVEVIGSQKGIQVDLLFNNDKFIFFLTR